MKIYLKYWFVVFMFIVSACAPASAPVATLTVTPNVKVVSDTPMPAEVITPRPVVTLTNEQALYPYTIEGLREHKFQSGEIFIRKVLLETKIFTRYLIEYPSDGLIITGILQVPTIGEPPYPVIIMNHGFFARADYTSGDGTDRAAEFLNRHGYLTVSSDYRSWGDSEIGESLHYSGLAIDVVNLMNALPSFPQADLNRMGMWGHSMGGGVTLKVLAIDTSTDSAQSPRIKAAVLYSSVSADFADIVGRWGPGRLGDIYESEQAYGYNSSDILPLNLPDDLIASYLNSVTDSDMLEAVSPLYHLDLVTAPVQIVYGTEDGQVPEGTPPEWSKKMYEGFVKAGKEAQLFAHPGEAHSFQYDEWYAFMERAVQFFDAHVK